MTSFAHLLPFFSQGKSLCLHNDGYASTIIGTKSGYFFGGYGYMAKLEGKILSGSAQ
jgi:hypothetical protein